jgi:hypothetical protein
MSRTVGAFTVLDLQAAMHSLEGIDPLQKFVLAYANVGPDGCRLTTQTAVQEALLFAVWLEACGKLGVRMSDPNLTVGGTPL